jgi:hypothetical protein
VLFDKHMYKHKEDEVDKAYSTHDKKRNAERKKLIGTPELRLGNNIEIHFGKIENEGEDGERGETCRTNGGEEGRV